MDADRSEGVYTSTSNCCVRPTAVWTYRISMRPNHTTTTTHVYVPGIASVGTAAVALEFDQVLWYSTLKKHTMNGNTITVRSLIEISNG